jgi:hypothetical protein
VGCIGRLASSGDGDGHLDLDRTPPRERGHADGGPGVAAGVAEHVVQ